jgi:putative ABC transport system permease protein
LRALDRKLLRDLRQAWGQAVAVALVIACAVAVYVMAVNTLSSLQRSQQAYYDRYQFAHVFAHLKRAPDWLGLRIAAIPGVARVQTRIVQHATLDVPGMADPALGRLVSIPDRPVPGLNSLYLRAGRYIEPGRTGEVLVSEGFASAHRFQPGDTLTAILNGRRQKLRIVGIALSPEYVYQIREGDLLPDDRRFAILWMGRTDLSAAFDMKGAFNDVALTLTPGASEPEVIRQIDCLTARYGGLGAYGRADQSSHEFVQNEMNELRGMARVVPAIFLGVSAFLLNVILSRLIGTQREQIAVLKAFGYTRREIGWHYLKFVLLIVFAGTLLGTAVGAWLGSYVTALYGRFFHFPVFAFSLDAAVVAEALLVTAAAAILGTLGAVWKAVVLPPAEAMRPEPPTRFRRTLVERLGLGRVLPTAARMIFRYMERRPVKTALTTLGIALATAVVVLGSFAVDAVDHALDAQFFVAQRQDVTVSFTEPASADALNSIRHLPGVRHCEPVRVVSARLRCGHRSRRVGVTGLRRDAELFRVIDVRAEPVVLPAEGIVLSKKLGELLGVKPTEHLTLEVLEGDRPVREVVVSGLVDDFSGMSAYMDVRAVHRLMREGAVVTGAFLAADASRLDALYKELKNTPRVANVTIKTAAVHSFRQTVAENLLRIRLFNVVFAGVIAFGVVYNSARIALAERARDLATLRVLGFTRGEVGRILLGELALLTLVAVPLGLLLGYALAYFLIRTAYDTELFRLPLVVSRWTYGFAAAVTLAAAVVSGFVVGRRLARLDMVTALKSRE